MSNSDIPENDSTENEIESPSDGPPPDWMKFATSGGEPSLTEENTPDWLKDIRSGKGSGAASQQETQETEDDDPYAGMSDLERLLAEEGIDLGTVSEERPQGSEGMSTRDWLISTSDDEMIRKKLGAEELVEEAPQAAPVAEVAPSPQESEDDDPYASMSDLERLLAEEGVDLSSVAEDRPEGSEGMSTRDWLISTSDDEMIRKKLGAEELEDTSPVSQAAPIETAPAPVEEPEVEAAPPAPIDMATYEDDDMMVVVDDLPDWLQDVDDETPPSPEPVAMVADEGEDDGLPDWLSEEEDSGPPPAPLDEPDFEAVTATVDEDDDMMVVEDDLPDWLQDVDDETPPAPEPIAMAADEGEDDGLPDWLSEEEDVDSTSVEESEVETAPLPAPIDTAADEDDDKMVMEDDLPDWLQDVDDEASPTPEPIVSDTDDMIVVEDDLPSWLSEGDDSDVTPAVEPDFEAVPPAPIETGPEEDMAVVEDDLPDWLAASNDEAVEEIEPSAQGMPDWLMEVEQDEDSGEKPSASSIEFAAPIAIPGEEPVDDTDEEDLPDWLREVQDDSDEEMPSAFTEGDLAEPLLDDTTDEEDLPVWLQEVQADEGEHPLFDDTMSVDDVVGDEDLPDWLSEVQQPDEPFEPSEPSPQEVEDYIEDDLPEWLQEAAEDSEVSEEELKIGDVAPAPILEAEAAEEDEVPIDDKELPAWLQDIEDEETDTYEEDSVPIPEPLEEPPAEEPRIADEVSAPAPEQPAPVAAAAPSEETSKKMPDWLKKLREGEEETLEASPAAVQVQPTPPPVPTPTPQPVVSRAAPPAPAPVTEDFGDLPHDADERLQIAQAARDKGDIDGAVHAYSSLISSGLYLDEIIEDMQQAIKSYPSNYLLYQTMGDAMMRDGRLQSALEAYRDAMAKLSG